MKELDDMSKDKMSEMNAKPINNDNIMHLLGWFPGPPDTPYAGGTFNVDILLPDNYPFVPPKMKFETRVWHPNISSQTVPILSPPPLGWHILTMCYVRRAPSASTLSRKSGLLYLRSRLRCSRCNPFLQPRSQMIHKTQRLPG
jgi:hypothetical protein